MKKSQLIYHYIREQESVSKQDIVIGLRLSLPTITQNLQYLEQIRLIDTSKKFPSTGERGRNATAYTYLKEARAAIGVYLTGHHINSVAVDLSGDVIRMVRERREFDLGDDGYLRKIGETVEKVKQEAGISDENLLGVGIAVPGLVSEAGYAEVWISKDICNAFYISLSNSVGGAAIVDKNIYEGNRQKGGEIGHMTVVPEGGELCYCGRRGCFDTVCRSTNLDQYTDGNLEQFFELLEAGDKGAAQLWDQYLDDLSLGIHNIRVLFDSVIILGGYVGAYIENYMDELCRRVDERDAFDEKAKDYLVPCKYTVESAAAGAAIFYIDEFFNTI